jgi:hypothetical protein
MLTYIRSRLPLAAFLTPPPARADLKLPGILGFGRDTPVNFSALGSGDKDGTLLGACRLGDDPEAHLPNVSVSLVL